MHSFIHSSSHNMYSSDYPTDIEHRARSDAPPSPTCLVSALATVTTGCRIKRSSASHTAHPIARSLKRRTLLAVTTLAAIATAVATSLLAVAALAALLATVATAVAALATTVASAVADLATAVATLAATVAALATAVARGAAVALVERETG